MLRRIRLVVTVSCLILIPGFPRRIYVYIYTNLIHNLNYNWSWSSNSSSHFRLFITKPCATKERMERMSLADWQDSPDERPATIMSRFHPTCWVCPKDMTFAFYSGSFFLWFHIPPVPSRVKNSKTLYVQSMHQAGPGMAWKALARQNCRIQEALIIRWTTGS